MNTKPSQLRTWRIIASMLVAASPTLLAQTTSSLDEEIIELSPFEVNESDNTGYQPNSTTSLTGVRQDLKDLPFSVEVFSQDMIKDIGATELNQIVGFATNAIPTQGGENLEREASFRGITSRFSRRNQYIWYNPSDSFSIGRVEIIRGPSSLLYGQGEPGGLINFQTKQAIFGRDSYSGTVRIGDHSNYRGEFEVNKALGSRGAIVIAGVYDDGDSWRQNVSKELKGYYGNLRFKLMEKTILKAEVESVVRDDLGPSDVIEYNGVQLNRAPELLRNPSVADGLITKENSQSWGGTLPRQRTWSNYSLGLEHSFNEHLALDLGWNVQTQDTDNDQVGGFSDLLAPNLTNASTADDEWRVTRGFQLGTSWNTVETARARLVADFEIGPTEHQFVVGGVTRSDHFELVNYQERINNGNPTAGAARPNEVFLVKNGADYVYPTTPQNPVSALNPLGYVFKPSFTIINEEALKGGYAVWMGKFFEERLQTVTGIRRDSLEKINELNDTVQFSTNQTTYNAGVNYKITDEISGYFNYAESFKAPGAFRVDPLNNTLPPAIGSGIEFGLKFDLFNKKVSGLVTYFDTSLEGDDFNLGGNSASRNAIDPAGLNGRNGGNFVPVDTASKGYEVQFVANPTKNLTFTFGYGFSDATSASDVSYQKFFNDGYSADANGNPLGANGQPLMKNGQVVTKSAILLNAAGNITNAAALGLVGTGVTGSTTNQVTGQPTPILTIVAGGEKVAGRPEHNLTSLIRYDFRDGALKGWWLGGNARFRWDYVSGYTGDVLAGNRLLIAGDDFVVLGANIGYRKKMDRFTWSTQLVINNILDADYYEGIYGGERWGDARTIVWSNTFKF